jgi:hypothetical protein
VEISFHARTLVGTLKVSKQLMVELRPQLYGIVRVVDELGPCRTSQGDSEVVHHNCLITANPEDGGDVDLKELGRVDRPIVLVKHGWPGHQMQRRCECCIGTPDGETT